MKHKIYTLILALIPVWVFSMPQTPVGNQKEERLSWELYRRIDMNTLSFLSAQDLEPSVNPYIFLEFPVLGHNNQGYPIFELGGGESLPDSGLVQMNYIDGLRPALKATSFLQQMQTGSNFQLEQFDLVAYDDMELNLILSSHLVLSDGNGAEIFSVTEPNGGALQPVVDEEKGLIAWVYGADRDAGHGLKLADIHSGDVLAVIPGEDGFVFDAPVMEGDLLFTVAEGWYQDQIRVTVVDLISGKEFKYEFSDADFSYWTGFSEEGLLFRDCEGEEFLFHVGEEQGLRVLQ